MPTRPSGLSISVSEVRVSCLSSNALSHSISALAAARSSAKLSGFSLEDPAVCHGAIILVLCWEISCSGVPGHRSCYVAFNEFNGLCRGLFQGQIDALKFWFWVFAKSWFWFLVFWSLLVLFCFWFWSIYLSSFEGR